MNFRVPIVYGECYGDLNRALFSQFALMSRVEDCAFSDRPERDNRRASENQFSRSG